MVLLLTDNIAKVRFYRTYVHFSPLSLAALAREKNAIWKLKLT